MDIKTLYLYKKYQHNTIIFLILLTCASALLWCFFNYIFLKEANAYPVELVGTSRRHHALMAIGLMSWVIIISVIAITCIVMLPNKTAIKQLQHIINSMSYEQRQQLQLADQSSYHNKERYIYLSDYLFIQHSLFFRVIGLNKVHTLQLERVKAKRSPRNKIFSLTFPDVYPRYTALNLVGYDNIASNKMRYLIYLIKNDHPNINIINAQCLNS